MRFLAGILGFLLGVLTYPLSNFGWAGVAWIALLGAIFIFLYAASRRMVFTVSAIFLLTASVGAARVEFAPRYIPDAFAPLLTTDIALEGRVVADPEMRETSQHIVVETEREGERMKVLASVPAFAELSYGDIVRVSGKLETPRPFETDGDRVFAYDWFLAKDGIFATMPRASVEVVAPRSGFSVLAVLYDIKHALIRALEEALPEPESALAIGILVGGKQGLGKDALDAFAATGLLQIVVLSGYNVMLVAEGVRKIFAFLPRAASLSLGGISVVAFVLMAGAGSSAVRAGIMALIALYARATGRTYDALRGLAAALILMCLISPLSLLADPGLQLSAIATFGLIIGTPLVESRLSFIRSRFLRDIVATTVAAQVAVLPLLLYETGNLSLVSLLANVLAMPVIPAAMFFSFLASLISLATPLLAPIAGLPAYFLLAYVIGIADVGAALPHSHLTVPAFPFPLVILAYALLAWCVLKLKRAAALPRPVSSVASR